MIDSTKSMLSMPFMIQAETSSLSLSLLLGGCMPVLTSALTSAPSSFQRINGSPGPCSSCRSSITLTCPCEPSPRPSPERS